jgi:hypothetical protein
MVNQDPDDISGLLGVTEIKGLRKIQTGAVAKSYMRKGFLIYEEIRKFRRGAVAKSYMTKGLLIYV